MLTLHFQVICCALYWHLQMLYNCQYHNCICCFITDSVRQCAVSNKCHQIVLPFLWPILYLAEKPGNTATNHIHVSPSNAHIIWLKSRDEPGMQPQTTTSDMVGGASYKWYILLHDWSLIVVITHKVVYSVNKVKDRFTIGGMWNVKTEAIQLHIGGCICGSPG